MVQTKHDSNVFLSEYGNEVLYLNSITFYPNTINSKEMTSSGIILGITPEFHGRNCSSVMKIHYSYWYNMKKQLAPNHKYQSYMSFLAEVSIRVRCNFKAKYKSKERNVYFMCFSYPLFKTLINKRSANRAYYLGHCPNSGFEHPSAQFLGHLGLSRRPCTNILG